MPPPKFRHMNHKTKHILNHVVKFHGDRRRELGDLAVKKTRNLS